MLYMFSWSEMMCCGNDKISFKCNLSLQFGDRVGESSVSWSLDFLLIQQLRGCWKLVIATEWLNMNSPQCSLRNRGIWMARNSQPRSGLNTWIIYCSWILLAMLTVGSGFLFSYHSNLLRCIGAAIHSIFWNLSRFFSGGFFWQQKYKSVHVKWTFIFNKLAHEFLNTILFNCLSAIL